MAPSNRTDFRLVVETEVTASESLAIADSTRRLCALYPSLGIHHVTHRDWEASDCDSVGFTVSVPAADIAGFKTATQSLGTAYRIVQ